MSILLLDNYDSFTWNLVQYVEELSGERPAVFRNDEISIEQARHFDKIILSPGPGLPSESGILCDLIRAHAASKSILGVCLGLQAIGEVFGGRLKNLERPYHGVSTAMRVLAPDDLLFKNIPSEFQAGRYHSWVVERASLPDCFELTCEDEADNVMAFSHKTLDVRGVQFHPESVMTGEGKRILGNWLA